MTLTNLTAHEAQTLLNAGEISSEKLTEEFLRRIETIDSNLGAFITITPELAIAKAREADKKLKTGNRRSLLGIPIAVKDNICTNGIRTTCASKILENYIPPYDATVISSIYSQGAVLIGKTNMDEFAMGSSTENSGFKTTKNPWNLKKVPGGSSGGSAAAVAANETILALGSDTGGSIRQPAGFCGVVGMKPSYGTVSRFGLIAFASSLDQIGPITKDVHDAAILMDVIAHHDSRDNTSIPNRDTKSGYYLESLLPDIKGFRIGVPKEYFIEGIQSEVKAGVKNALQLMQDDMGAKLIDISLPHTEYSLATYYIISSAEASSNLARYDGVKYGLRVSRNNLDDMYKSTRGKGFGPEVKRRIMLGTFALSAGYHDEYYRKAQKVRSLLIQDFDHAFQECDVIITPVAPYVAFGLGEKLDDPLQMYLSDIFTLPINLAGLCSISIPCGFSDGLPIGMQIIGPYMAEATIFRVAYAYEQATNWNKFKPPIS